MKFSVAEMITLRIGYKERVIHILISLIGSLILIFYVSACKSQENKNEEITQIFSHSYSQLNFPLMKRLSDKKYLVSFAGNNFNSGLYIVNLENKEKAKISDSYDIVQNINNKLSASYFLLKNSQCEKGVCSAVYELFLIKSKIYRMQLVNLLFDAVEGGCGRPSLKMKYAKDNINFHIATPKKGHQYFEYSYILYDCSSNTKRHIKKEVVLNNDSIKEWELIYD